MTDTPTAFAEAPRALLNLETLAGLFSHLDELAGLFGDETLKLFDARTRGTLAPLGWALQALAGEQTRADFVEKEPGDAWRDAALLMGVTVDFVQGFLERWRGGVLGEVTAEVLSAGVVGPVHTFKAKRIRRECFLDADGAGLLETVQVEGEARELLALDALLADMLDGLGQAPMAAHIRKTPPEKRGKRWTGNAPKACALVFEFVWADLKRERERAAKEAQARAEKALEEAKHNRPALPRVVLVDQLFPAMTKQLQLLDDGKVRSDKGRVLGAIVVDADTTLAVVRAGAALLGSEPGHEMIHELVHRAFDAHEAGASDPRRVGFIGGWGALAEAIGYGKGDHSILKLIAKAGQSIEWQTRHIGAGGLWTWTDKRGSRHGGAGEVAFVLGDALLPGLAAAMKREPLARTLSAREARRLVVEPRYKPPTSGVRPNERGAVWTLWRLFMLELTDKSVEYCGKGSIAVTVPRWRELHEQARLPWATHEKVLASWLEGESAKAPAFLAELEPGRFDLAPVHDLERVFLAEQGRRRLESATEGAKGPRAKASKKRK